ncbi:Tubby-related protein 4, partial [Varanus komodoensis]
GGGGGSSSHLILKVQSHVAQLFLDVTDNLTLSCQREEEEFSSLPRTMPPKEGRRAMPLTSGTARGVEGQHSLNGHIHGRDVEGLKHDLGHLFTVGLGVEGGLSEQGGVLLRGHAELIVEGVVPDLLHVIPVGDDAMFNGVLQGQDTSFALSFIPYVGVFLTHTHHDTLRRNLCTAGVQLAQLAERARYLMTWAANNGGEHSPGGIISGKASLHQARAIVADER